MADDVRNPTAAAVNEAAAAGEAEADSSEDQRDVTPSVPAGEPEAPVGPAPPEPAEPSPPEPSEPEPRRHAPGPEPELDSEARSDVRAEGEDEDHEARLAHDLEELTARAQKADEYLELAQRTKADFENFRKRAAREAGAAQQRGVIKLARELLPAVDNLDRAVDAAGKSSDGADLVAGIKLVHAEVLAALARVGVEPFHPEGEPFDPSCHEAVAQQPVEGTEAGTVAEVYQRGYRLGETVIRPARVLVAG
jgi:molecular chaperone GrpE